MNRETKEALDHWQDEQRTGRREMYGKFDDLAASIGNVEKSAAAAPGRWKSFVLNLSIVINGALAAGLGTVIWYIITKGGG